MHVLELVDYQVIPTEECFLIKPLRDLYNKDKSKNKEKFFTQLSVVYFMADPRSSYSYMLDDDERLKAIIEQEGLPADYKISEELEKAINCYKSHVTSPSSKLLESMLIAIDKVSLFLRDVDLKAVDDKGKPMYTINSITAAIRQIPALTKELQNAQKSLNSEIEEIGRARGGNESKKAFEDGI